MSGKNTQTKRASPTYLLLQSHNLEALEVGQVLPPLNLGSLLGPAGLSPLAINVLLLPQLLNSASAGTAGGLGDDEGREGGVVKVQRVTRDNLVLLGRGTIDQHLQSQSKSISSCLHSMVSSVASTARKTYTLVVNDLDNHGQLASVRPSADQHHTADLNEFP